MDFAIRTVDNEIYFCDSYSYETEGIRLDGSGVTLVVFRPKNGVDRGCTHKLPLARVTSIVDRSERQ